MRARQREGRIVVVERGRNPGRRRVAGLALRGDAGLRVIRAGRSVEIARVATEAIRRRSCESSVDVARCAIERHVRSRKREAGDFQVIEFRAKPGIGRVAGLAFCAKRRMVRHCFLQIRRVAGNTLGGKSGELAGRSALVAIDAFQRSVCAKQWKPIYVLLNLLRVKTPGLHGVALLTIRPELPAMNVGVAIRATSARVRKHKTRMAFAAVHILVHSEQREFRAIVVEFRIAADRFPSTTCVAILARHVDRTMRIVRSGSLRRGLRRQTDCSHQKDGEQ